MKTTLWIAWRYFLSRKKAQFINIIALLSMFGICVGTTALILILSVFNGLEGLIRDLHKTINPELKITLVEGKSFEVNQEFIKKTQNVEGVEIITEVIEDNAVMLHKNKQMVITIKGVSNNYLEQLDSLKQTILQGEFALIKDNKAYAVVGSGVQYMLSINIYNPLEPLQIWYPKRLKKINMGSLSPEGNFNQRVIMPSGVFGLEQQYDASYVFVPLAFAEDLLEYKNRRTSLEIKTNKKADIQKVKSDLEQTLGNKFKVLNRQEQQASLLKAIKIEKLFVFVTLSFVLGVAAFNIFFSLMMLVIDKSKDIAVLYAMGGDASWIKNIFVWVGSLIALSGGGLGLFLGASIGFLQQKYGLIKMGTQTTLVDAYPIALKIDDFIFTTIIIVSITILSSLIPARYASRLDPKQHLKG